MKIGIVRIDRMGDMILTLPIIKAIKLQNPNFIIHIFCSNKNHKIIKNFKYVDKIFNIDNSSLYNDEKYDYIFNFSPGWKSLFKCFFLKSIKKNNLILSSRYKKKITSKLLILIFSKIFFNTTLYVNRINRFYNNISIHQTQTMFELLNKCKISYFKDINLEKFLENFKLIKSNRDICTVHLSKKWINKYYNEENLLQLIAILNKKYNIALTTDETTYKEFTKIFNKYPIIENNAYSKDNYLKNILIFKDFNFENWISIIQSSKLVITPECGCTHIAAICKIKSKIIYDADNNPEMIYQEYYPWKSDHEKFTFDEINLNSSLTKNL